MSLFYLDTSAWVKRYVDEPGSPWIHHLFNSRQRLASVSLGYVETVAALSGAYPNRSAHALNPASPSIGRT